MTTRWFLVVLVFGLQGCCSAVDGRIADNTTEDTTTPTKPKDVRPFPPTPPSPLAAANGNLVTTPRDASPSPPTTTTPKLPPANTSSHSNLSATPKRDAFRETVRNSSKRTFSVAKRTHSIQTNTRRRETSTSTTESVTDEETPTTTTAEPETTSSDDTENTTLVSSSGERITLPTETEPATDNPIAEPDAEKDTQRNSVRTSPLVPLTKETKDKAPDSPSRAPCLSECGAVPNRNRPLQQTSSPLAKLVLKLSKPGVFERGKSVFEDDLKMDWISCPPGDVGLSCRRAEARRGADECYGGNCEVCRSCDEMAVTDWPHCCRENFRCCSELALACQQCNKPTLQVFCTKHFKRCF